MASAVAMMIGGAVVNALAFSGSKYLFSQMGKSDDAEKERERHNKAVEQLEEAQDAWSKKRTERLDFINEEMQKKKKKKKKRKKNTTQNKRLMM